MAAPLVTVASARITGIAVPETIKPGDSFTAVVEVSNYIQSVYDLAIVSGVAPLDYGAEALETVLDSEYLGSDKSDTYKNMTFSVKLPSDYNKGPAAFHASLMSLYGVSSGPSLTNFQVNITIGDETSTTFKSGGL